MADPCPAGLNDRRQYNNKKGEWFAEDRFHINGTVKPTDSITSKLYYVLLSTDSDTWIHRHVAALTVGLSF